jgi:hypothetical protein
MPATAKNGDRCTAYRLLGSFHDAETETTPIQGQLTLCSRCGERYNVFPPTPRASCEGILEKDGTRTRGTIACD